MDDIALELDTSYPGCLDDLAEKRRAFIFECMANAEIDGRILIENCAIADEWIKTGTRPTRK